MLIITCNVFPDYISPEQADVKDASLPGPDRVWDPVEHTHIMMTVMQLLWHTHQIPICNYIRITDDQAYSGKSESIPSQAVGLFSAFPEGRRLLEWLFFLKQAEHWWERQRRVFGRLESQPDGDNVGSE